MRQRKNTAATSLGERPCQSESTFSPCLHLCSPPTFSCPSFFRAAFQYGVKMNDGRKTRRYGGLSDKAREKAKFNREWQQISQVRRTYILGCTVLVCLVVRLTLLASFFLLTSHKTCTCALHGNTCTLHGNMISLLLQIIDKRKNPTTA